MIAQPHPVDQDILVIEVDDSINDDVTEQVVNDLIENIKRRQDRKIIMNCSRLEFLSSFGVSLLLRLRHAVQGSGGEIKLCGLSVVVERVLEMSKVAALFKRYVDLNAARTGFLSGR